MADSLSANIYFKSLVNIKIILFIEDRPTKDEVPLGAHYLL